MRRLSISRLFHSLLLTGFAAFAPSVIHARQDVGTSPPAPDALAVDFPRDIEPILAARCFPCHATEEHKGGLTLDTRDHLLAGGDSGPAIEPNDSESSLLFEKIAGLDPAGIMPPKGKGQPLTADEIQRLRAWIDQGAQWAGPTLTTERAAYLVGQQHWAFQPPARLPLPTIKEAAWPRNPIDHFVLARLEAEGMAHASEADKPTLLRRLSLDLLGLPPTPTEVEAFLADTRPDAYERLVDRLLASPAYGERWARRWLDLARYADTNGYEKDRERIIWPYRDWVIRALNTDMPFEQFTIEQIAGDLLPNATLDQQIATGFHRNTMINEEGGIDVEEFRFTSLVDRIATTGTTWLGLTINCAQCHTHKYDPIPQTDYYRLMAMIDNADEPEIVVPDPAIEARRNELTTRIETLQSNLSDRFPLPDAEGTWAFPKPAQSLALTTSGEASPSFEIRPDDSILVSGSNPDKITYSLVVDTTGLPRPIDAIRIEALTDPALPATGPGRTPHGNFVVTGVRVHSLDEGQSDPTPILVKQANADFTQTSFDPSGVLDADDATGWAIDDGSGHLNKNRSLTLSLAHPLPHSSARLHLQIEQNYGGRHTLGRFRVSLRQTAPPADVSVPEPERRALHLAARQAEWERTIPTADWTPLAPTQFNSRKHATMDVLDDSSILVSGDKPNNDVYDLTLSIPQDTDAPITALRIEALPHPSHPDNGPGRAPLFSVGDFILTEVEARATPDGPLIPFDQATTDHAEANKPGTLVIDGQPDTGWSIRGQVGKPHHIVLEFASPLSRQAASSLHLTLHQFGIHQMTLGRFRVSYTTTPGSVRASAVPAQVESALRVAFESRTDSDRRLIRHQFLASCEELAPARAEIDALATQLPHHPTTLVLQERRPEHNRVTRVHRRGEFLQPLDSVQPGTPSALHPLPSDTKPDRQALARWLVADDNPLAARVVVNRDWHTLFGRGLVATLDDFGSRGDRPTHPELLDFLACQFADNGWSRKALHRLIVTSATYRQDSRISPEALSLDPTNALLARGSRFRVDAEAVRDIALAASGLIDQRLGGPSVYPPQPEAVTALAYGGASWPTSTGPDRYRRALYTFTKRTAPFAAYTTFDMPTSETTCARRDRSNTPLQSLTLLNDTTFLEAARALALRVLREVPSSADLQARIDYASLLILGRHASASDPLTVALRDFHQALGDRLNSGTLDAKALAGDTPTSLDPIDHATWTAIARVLLNLDETITRE